FGRAQERGADGGEGRPAAREPGASVDAAFRRQCARGRRGAAGGGAGPCVDAAGAACSGVGLGGGGYGDPEEGPPLGGGGETVLRRAGQDGELPGGGLRVAGHRVRELNAVIWDAVFVERFSTFDLRCLR